MTDAERTATTYRYERWRAAATGILEAAGSVFLLLIAVRGYHAGPTAKALVASGGSLGLMLAPWVVSRVEASGWPVARAASYLAALGAASFVVMALVPWLTVYVIGCVVALTTSSAAIPLMTQIYQENYPDRERGQRFARTTMLRIAVTAGFSHLAGRALSNHFHQFAWLLLTFAGASALASFVLSRYPSRPLTASGGTHPFHALRFIRTDRL